jgi:branched-chain amino acid transport system permease protein
MGGQLAASLTDGVLLGFVYGLAAMGLSLIWGIMRVINLAHGAVMALGMFGTYLISNALGINPYLALLPVAGLGLGFGVVMYAGSVHRVIQAPYLSSLLATFAVNMMIIGVSTAVFTTSPRNIDFTLGSLQIGQLSLQGTRLAAALAAVMVTTALYLFLYRTTPGKAVRAVANNRAAAELMGIPSERILALSFGLGTMLAAVAGGLIATFFPFTVLSGDVYQPKCFVICVLGGLGHPLGALAGGLILGMIEGLIPTFMPVSWVPVVEYGLFIMVLLVRPSGLFGAR